MHGYKMSRGHLPRGKSTLGKCQGSKGPKFIKCLIKKKNPRELFLVIDFKISCVNQNFITIVLTSASLTNQNERV